jgi:hypothetical protein
MAMPEKSGYIQRRRRNHQSRQLIYFFNDLDSEMVRKGTSVPTKVENLPSPQCSAMLLPNMGMSSNPLDPTPLRKMAGENAPTELSPTWSDAILGAEFWADALVYASYLYNRTYHTAIGKTPFEAWNGTQPDLGHIRTFGSSVTVKKPGRRPTKGDPHCYHGIFLRYTATRKNLVYYDINSKRTKTAAHKLMDEFHYGNPLAQRPKMAQHMIDIAADNQPKKHSYGVPITLDEFGDLIATPMHTAAAAAKLEALPADDTDPATITAIYEPNDGFQDSDILNVEMSLDIFGPSTTEIVAIDTRHPTLGFEFQSAQP